jgi:uncharacterized protein (TIGR02246 family)
MSNQDEAQIRQLIEEKAAALRARDADRMIAAYAPDVVQFDLAPPLRHVGPEVRDATSLRTWLAGFHGPMDMEVRDLVVTVGGDVAICHSLNCLTATPQGMTESFSLWFRVTLGLRRHDGTWLISHEHESTPFEMDGSFRASVDLKP